MRKHAGKKSYDLFYGQWSISKENKISSVFIIEWFIWKKIFNLLMYLLFVNS